MVGAIIGGVLFVLLLLVGGAVAVTNLVDEITASSTTTTRRRTTTSRGPTTTSERTTIPTAPSTSVTGTGPATMLTAVQAADLLKEEVGRVNPGLSIGIALCPRATYRVGHVMECRVRLQDALVTYRVEVTGERTIKADPVRPIVDTEEAKAVMEAREPGSRPTCLFPRIRQLEIGTRLTCRTTTTTWDFTVTPTGELEGAPR